MKQLLTALLLLTLAACGGDATKIKPVTYADVPGWSADKHAEPFTLFADSCRVNATRKNAYRAKDEGPVGDRENWNRVCREANALQNPSDADARAFFEQNFQPYKVETEKQPQGLITGYYEPILNGSRIRKAPFLTPVYGMPDDLGSRKPYYTRAEIIAGAARGHAPILLYVDDPVLLFFLHVQGSGKVRLRNGSMVGLQYAGQNGYSYTPIGRILKDRGELDTLSMQSIRDWLLSHPDQMDEVMNQNQSYIFFKLTAGDKPAKGALGVCLTPLRSLAVDAGRAAYGVPTFLDTTHAEYGTGAPVPMQRLFISQDTGGAIKGPHRGDVFYGQGEHEEWLAGHQNARANVFWLLPRDKPLDLKSAFPEKSEILQSPPTDATAEPAPVAVVPSEKTPTTSAPTVPPVTDAAPTSPFDLLPPEERQ